MDANRGPLARSEDMNVPLARSEGLVIEELGDELLVYDMDANYAHALGPVAARVWRECDGRTKAHSIADELELTADDVRGALGELDRCELLVTPAGTNGGMSRRDFGLRVAKVGAIAASAPLIVSVAAPTPAAATTVVCSTLSTTGHGCGECGSNTANCCCCQFQGTTGPTKRCADDEADCDVVAKANGAAQKPNGSYGNCSTT